MRSFPPHASATSSLAAVLSFQDEREKIPLGTLSTGVKKKASVRRLFWALLVRQVIFSYEQSDVVLHFLGSERETHRPALDAGVAELHDDLKRLFKPRVLFIGTGLRLTASLEIFFCLSAYTGIKETLRVYKFIDKSRASFALYTAIYKTDDIPVLLDEKNRPVTVFNG